MSYAQFLGLVGIFVVNAGLNALFYYQGRRYERDCTEKEAIAHNLGYYTCSAWSKKTEFRWKGVDYTSPQFRKPVLPDTIVRP